MTKEKTEVKVLTYEEKLEKQVRDLEVQLEQLGQQFHQVTGALHISRVNLEEFKKDK